MSGFQRSMAVAMVAVVTGLAGCSEPVVEQEAAIKPVKSYVVDADVTAKLRNLPARIEASKRAEMSFRVSGNLTTIEVKEGDLVEEGQLLAQLDPTDLQLRVNDAKARYDRSNADYKRAQELIKKDFISRTDYDKLEAEFKSARAALNSARTDLGYTKMEAPFTGTIARRYVENFERIQAQQPVFSLTDTSQVEVVINLPERLVLLAKAQNIEINAVASFANAPGQEFQLELKEYATKADPQTQTFEATFLMDQPEGLEVLPGMTARVRMEANLGELKTAMLIPSTAVIAKADMKPQVWIVDPESKTVSSREVEIGELVSDRIEIFSGLEPGERVVTAGASFLVEGQQVRIIKVPEQADPSTAP